MKKWNIVAAEMGDAHLLVAPRQSVTPFEKGCLGPSDGPRYSSGSTFSLPSIGLPAHQLERFRARRHLPQAWSKGHYLTAVAESTLKAKVKDTLIVMAQCSDGQYTTISREFICRVTGIRRTATVTEHWHQARSEGLLYSRRRYDRSSVHKLMIPGVDTPDIDEIEMHVDRNTHAHIWSFEEELWWYSLDTELPQPPPWGEEISPF